MPHLKAVNSHNIPGAWYDLTVRIEEARAVASCALESLPCGLRGTEYDRINSTGHLIAATADILALMAADAELLATQLKL